ncbi:MAG TPA: aminoacyl-tRNA hydrolase [Chthoniobacteraceae bacterium]|nr:aminoacyl-tRNA hydrolase [Chthoniobacteraceae bacterium]
MSSEPLFRLIAGLGNPGREYEETRHNAGFMIVDRLAQRAGIPFRIEPKWNAAIANAGGVLLCKPRSYMNLSGEPLAAVARFYKIDPAQILAVFDDVALPLGRIRIRPSGSSGGHNGMESILRQVGDIPRLRIGIGAADGRAMVDHVLGKFQTDERPLLAQSLDRAVEAIDFLQQKGIAAAMNQFN